MDKSTAHKVKAGDKIHISYLGEWFGWVSPMDHTIGEIAVCVDPGPSMVAGEKCMRLYTSQGSWNYPIRCLSRVSVTKGTQIS